MRTEAMRRRAGTRWWLACGLLSSMVVTSGVGAQETPGGAAIETPWRVVVGQPMMNLHSRALPFDAPEWWLSHHVATQNGPAPENPKPVWVQFGFMGCAPCEQLAALAGRELPGVEKVYVHLDNILLSDQKELYPNKPALWRALVDYAGKPAYAGFTFLYGNGEPLLQQLCGREARVPSAILVGADGRVAAVLSSPSEADARAAFARVSAR